MSIWYSKTTKTVTTMGPPSPNGFFGSDIHGSSSFPTPMEGAFLARGSDPMQDRVSAQWPSASQSFALPTRRTERKPSRSDSHPHSDAPPPPYTKDAKPVVNEQPMHKPAMDTAAGSSVEETRHTSDQWGFREDGARTNTTLTETTTETKRGCGPTGSGGHCETAQAIVTLPCQAVSTLVG
ncbi:hypothetical protein BC629DRAFT_1601006 [Irpex lacteus]|nr:hypothetical protein BC629DRAFT_1601006 [Irpex lacteus]